MDPTLLSVATLSMLLERELRIIGGLRLVESLEVTVGVLRRSLLPRPEAGKAVTTFIQQEVCNCFTAETNGQVEGVIEHCSAKIGETRQRCICTLDTSTSQ